MTEAVMFGPDGKNILPASILYKKNILAFRGSFRPITKVGIDIYKNAEALFLQERRVVKKNTEVIFEITLSNLGADGAIDEADFMDRAKLLSSLGYTVLLSNFKEYYKLVEYFARFTKMRIGLAMGVSNLIEVFDQKYYKNLGGGILEASGKLFSKDMKVYLYPMLLEETNEVINNEKLDRYLDPNILKLYQFFREAGRIVDIENYNEDYLKIFSKKVLKMIENDEEGWEKLLPEGVPDIIKEQCLFSCVAIPSKRTTVIK